MKRTIATLLSLLFVVSAASTPLFASGAPWCVVTSYQSFCYYYDISSCQRAAHQQPRHVRAEPGSLIMSMERRLGFTLDAKQIEQACIAYIAARLLPDEEASARVILNKLDLENVHIFCDIAVSKRVRKPRQNGAQA